MAERLNKLSSYFNEKERARLDELTRNNLGGLPEMSVSIIIFIFLLIILNYHIIIIVYSLMK
jgi:hypothetical protein